ncbi:hypothetical protein D9981_11685 [Pseudoalteromonas phenolica O-BC30]|nr:hypothetical protein D9981_11685 [Pseudoalteromonas phenolica O-BC30]
MLSKIIDKKQKNAEKQIFNQRHNEVTLHFKTKTSEFVAAGALPSKYSGTVNAIVNNFFCCASSFRRQSESARTNR